MTFLPEYEIESGTQASRLESLEVIHDAGPSNAGENSQPTRKRSPLPDGHEEKRRRTKSIDTANYTNGHKKQRTEVLSKYNASYRLNSSGSGVFIINKKPDVTAEVFDKVRYEHTR